MVFSYKVIYKFLIFFFTCNMLFKPPETLLSSGSCR